MGSSISTDLSQVSSLRECIRSLQAGAASVADAELASLRQKVLQLENALRGKTTEADKLRSV